jgi:hypothetical protein
MLKRESTMYTPSPESLRFPTRRSQRGVTTLTVVLLLLGIITIIVLFSTNVAYFEQRTTTNENRARIGEQAAELALNVTGEWLKSQLAVIVSSRDLPDAADDGWLNPALASHRWARCADATEQIEDDSYVHPCESIIGNSMVDASNPFAELYFYSRGGVATGNADPTTPDVAGTDIHNVIRDPLFDATALGLTTQSNSTFAVAPKVQAVLCRIDATDPANPRCALEPERGNNIAITLISSASMGDESTSAIIKETWSSYNEFNPAATVPLVASGTVKGLGNAEIVAAPNAGGFGLPASIWSPCPVSVTGIQTTTDPNCESSGGVGSVSTCHLGGYLGDVPVSDLLTTCAGQGNACGCPASISDHDYLSGPQGGARPKGIDILDITPMNATLGRTDIDFFPGHGLDSDDDPTDDNLFEWIFNLDYVSKSADGSSLENDGMGETAQDCGDEANEDCAIWALQNELGARSVTCAQIRAEGEAARGLYYVTDSAVALCTLPRQLGSPTSPVIVVLDNEARLNASLVYGMVFVRSPDNSAVMRGTGNNQIFGALVVEGNADMAGSFTLVYVDWSTIGVDPEAPPPASFFGRVSGSWLDATKGL